MNSIYGMMRTAPLQMEPVPMAVGDSIQFAESKRWWKVRAASDRFVILTSPFNLRHTVFYSVIDWERGVRGPDDHYGVGYETGAQIADALRRLTLPDDHPEQIEVSHRAHSVRTRIVGQRRGITKTPAGAETQTRAFVVLGQTNGS